MGKRRIYEVAKELGMESKDLMKKLHDIGVDAKSHSSTVDEDDLKRALAGPAPKKPELPRAPGMKLRKKADIPVPEPEVIEPEDDGRDQEQVVEQVAHHHEPEQPVRVPDSPQHEHRPDPRHDPRPEPRVEARQDDLPTHDERTTEVPVQPTVQNTQPSIDARESVSATPPSQTGPVSSTQTINPNTTDRKSVV